MCDRHESSSFNVEQSGGAGGSANVDGGSLSDCDAMVAHELMACPTLSTDVELARCKKDTLTYDPAGLRGGMERLLLVSLSSWRERGATG